MATARRSDHFDGTRFVNPDGTGGQRLPAVFRMLREPRTPWPDRIDVPPAAVVPLEGARAAVTFIGHSTFLIQTAAANILIDPQFSERAGPFNVLGPRRVRPPAVRFDSLPAIDIVLLSHNHYDHCDLPTLRQLASRFDPVVVTPLGNAPLVRSAGIRRVEELDWWEHWRRDPLALTLTPARHFSARTPFDRNRALWGGFVVATPECRIYFAGDTAFDAFFPRIASALGPFDLALLPIGAYEPRWFMRVVHMNPEEAVQAHLALDPAVSIGMHFGTFQLTTEGIDEPLRALEEARQRHGVPAARFTTLAFGATHRIE